MKIPIKQRITKVIILGNGSPDDVVMTILTHKFNGTTVVGICKPEYLRMETIRAIKSIITVSTDIRKILLVIDQETQKLSELKQELERKMSEYGINHKLIICEKRLWIYECSILTRTFDEIIVINGLDRNYVKHTIEDHLLEIAKENNINVEELMEKSNGDPKSAWYMLSKKERGKVLESLVRIPTQKLSKFFPQHIKAIKHMLDSFL